MRDLLRVARFRLPSHSPLTRWLTSSGCEIRMNATTAQVCTALMQAQTSSPHPERRALDPCACVRVPAGPSHAMAPLPAASLSPVLSVLAFPGSLAAEKLSAFCPRSIELEQLASLLRSRSFIHSVLVKILLQSRLSLFLRRTPPRSGSEQG
jgi:hypothetical protein